MKAVSYGKPLPQPMYLVLHHPQGSTTQDTSYFGAVYLDRQEAFRAAQAAETFCVELRLDQTAGR